MKQLFAYFHDNLAGILISKFCVAFIIIFLTRMLIKTITPVIHDLCIKNGLDHHSYHVINKVVRWLITALGIMIALQNVGIEVNMALHMFLTLFGITGIVLSYGMKDIVANLIAGILILGYKYIKINDYIKIKDWEGKVVDINLRYTTIKNETTTILIPNIVLYTEPVGIIHSK